jgi:hypothetical protein
MVADDETGRLFLDRPRRREAEPACCLTAKKEALKAVAQIAIKQAATTSSQAQMLHGNKKRQASSCTPK